MNLKELGFSPELAFAKSGVSNDPVADVANSEKYIKAKWGSQDNTKVIDESRTEEVGIIKPITVQRSTQKTRKEHNDENFH